MRTSPYFPWNWAAEYCYGVNIILVDTYVSRSSSTGLIFHLLGDYYQYDSLITTDDDNPRAYSRAFLCLIENLCGEGCNASISPINTSVIIESKFCGAHILFSYVLALSRFQTYWACCKKHVLWEYQLSWKPLTEVQSNPCKFQVSGDVINRADYTWAVIQPCRSRFQYLHGLKCQALKL